MLQISPLSRIHNVPTLRANSLMLDIVLGLRILARINEFLRTSLRIHRDAVAYGWEPHGVAPGIETAPAVFAVPRVVIVAVLRGVSLHRTARHHLTIIQIFGKKDIGSLKSVIIHAHRTILVSVARVCKFSVLDIRIELFRHIKVAASRLRRTGGFRNPKTVMTNNLYPIRPLSFALLRARPFFFARATVRPC